MTAYWSPCDVCGKPVTVPADADDAPVYCSPRCWREDHPGLELADLLPPIRSEQNGLTP